ncbi:MAG: hypothetical protein RIG63_23985 [Coleofasciculus chthonoplastes F3-SA18-01]|uniref:hypothetical protein n=1 Tax=Coleofasciculus chthonoplastes TaxID=64178 RepID=UPI0032FE8D05
MSQNPDPRQSMGPLSVGNVVSAGLVLYRSHLQMYLSVALIATLWLAPANIIFFLLSSAWSGIASPFLPSWLLFLIWIPLMILGLSKYLVNSALISRLAFRELISQPERMSEARRQLNDRNWSFFRIAFQVGLLLVLVYIALAIVAVLVAVILRIIIDLVLGGLFANPFTRSIVATIIGGVIAVVILLGGLTWFFARWLIAEVPLAVEEEVNGKQSIDRSWELSKNSAFRIQGVVLITFLVTLPILILTGYAPQIFLLQLEPGSSLYWMVYLVSFIASLVGGILVLPFWQAIKAVVYYDLRSRREGLGMQLR